MKPRHVWGCIFVAVWGALVAFAACLTGLAQNQASGQNQQEPPA